MSADPPSIATIRREGVAKSDRVDVVRQVELSRRLPMTWARRAASEALRRHPLSTGSVVIALTDDAEIRRLNRTFRGQDKPTDVLTFSAGPYAGGALGDVAISVETAHRQATARGKSLKWELAVLALHGVLHLLGWDDESESDRDAMLAETNRTLEACGLDTDPDWGSIYAEAPAVEPG